jgi:hypothetical protein
MKNRQHCRGLRQGRRYFGNFGAHFGLFFCKYRRVEEDETPAAGPFITREASGKEDYMVVRRVREKVWKEEGL